MQYDLNGKPFDTHFPGAELDYGFNWGPWLQADEEVRQSVWSVEPQSGVVLERDQITNDAKLTSVFFCGGTECTTYTLTNTITTGIVGSVNDLRVDSRSITLFCQK